MLKHHSIEAIFCATDAPGHARHCLEVLKHGKRVAWAVPAVWENLEDAERLHEAAKTSGLSYMLLETPCYRGKRLDLQRVERRSVRKAALPR